MHRNNSSNGTETSCAPFHKQVNRKEKYNAQEEWMPEEANAVV